MLQVEMSGAVRTSSGKGAMRRLRDQGLTPAVVYGAGAESLSLQFETQPLHQELVKNYRKNMVVTLKLDNGQSRNVLVREVQTDPVTDSLIHVDFQEIDMDKKRLFNVPVQYTGSAKGCDLGGILQKDITSVTVEAVPLSVPDAISVDIADMNIGDALSVRDITVPENVTMLTAPETLCVSIQPPKKVVQEAAADDKGNK